MVKRLNDRYELGDELGAGGMGSVHRAVDLRLGREVAVKILRGDRVGDASARARFQEEARTAGRLSHPGIATVHDAGEDESGPDADPYIVMQLVQGTPLSTVLRERGTLPPQAVERLLGGVADALAAAHAAGVVHRDVKPANIILSTDSRPVLVDFGIALGASSEPLTETGAVLGTVEYISPEQARGQTATGASDVYSLGLVAYQCLTGTSPFRRETAVAAALAQVGEEPAALPSTVPAPLAALVTSMTAKDPLSRPSAVQVRDAVEGRTAGETSVLPVVGAPADDAPTVASTSIVGAAAVPTDDDRAGGSGRKRLLAGLAALVVALLLILLVGALAGGDGDGPSVPDVVGDQVADATTELESLGATVRAETVDDPDAEEGVVLAQDPEAGEALADGDEITLQVASGQVAVPDDLVGGSVDDATAALEDLGLKVRTTEVASGESEGTVVAVDRSGRVDVGSTVTLSVATAPEPVATTAPPVESPTPAPEDPADPKEKKPDEPKGDKGDKGKGKGKP